MMMKTSRIKIKGHEGHTKTATSVAFSTDWTKVVSGSFDKTVRLWDATTGKELTKIKGHTDYVNSVAFSPDGTKVASGSFDKTVRLWDATTGKELTKIEGHTGYVKSVAFSPDGTTVCSGSFDQSLILSELFPLFKVEGSSKVFEGLQVKSSQLVEEGVAHMATLENLDLWLWLLHLFDYKYTMSCADLAVLFQAVSDVMCEASVNSQTEGIYLQNAVKRFVRDVQKSRPTLLPELVQNLSSRELQKLAATKVMQILISELAKSGAMHLYYFEVFLFSVFIVCFTRATYILKFSEEVVYVTHNSSDMTWVVFSAFLGVAFVAREVLQIFSMRKLGLTTSYFKDFWNYVDFLASLGTVVTIAIFFVAGPGELFNHFASVSAMLMWMKFLGIIKALNQQIATFVLMLSTILVDVRAFLVVMGLVMIMFGHALFMVMGLGDHGYEANENDGENQKFATIGGTMGSLYSMMLGNYDPEDFVDYYQYWISVVFMFMIVIVMLNVLIAIVSDSYDAAMVKSTELFWRARLELVAEIKTTFKIIDHEKLDEFAKRRGRNDDGEEGFASQFGMILIAYDVKDAKGWAIRILLFPLSVVLVPLICLYIFALVPAFQKLTGRLRRAATADIDLQLGIGDSDDEWSGRVLDIVKRINTHSSTEGAKHKAEIDELKQSMVRMVHMVEEQRRLAEEQNTKLNDILNKLGSA
jgi:hypothetical protein